MATRDIPATSGETDDDLVLRLQGGDGSAFAELVARHQSSLIGFFIRQTHDPQLAEDLTQETLLRVYNQAWDYLPRGAFRGWMFRIARNLLVDNVRRRSGDALLYTVGNKDAEDSILDRMTDEVVSPHASADQNEVTSLVEELLPELPEDQRLTFILYHFNGLSLPEVADIMECNLPTCKSRLRLAREKLRDKLIQRGVRDPGLDPDSGLDRRSTAEREEESPGTG